MHLRKIDKFEQIASQMAWDDETDLVLNLGMMKVPGSNKGLQ